MNKISVLQTKYHVKCIFYSYIKDEIEPLLCFYRRT